MTTGIREFCNTKFAEHLPAFHAGTMDGTAFRAAVMNAVVEQFSISVASAATHYNYSLKQQRIADARSVHNLGRPEGKTGGRPLQHPVTLIKARSGEVVQENISRGRANLLITVAERRNKAKLAIKEDVEAAAAKAAAEAVAPTVEQTVVEATA